MSLQFEGDVIGIASHRTPPETQNGPARFAEAAITLLIVGSLGLLFVLPAVYFYGQHEVSPDEVDPGCALLVVGLVEDTALVLALGGLQAVAMNEVPERLLKW